MNNSYYDFESCDQKNNDYKKSRKYLIKKNVSFIDKKGIGHLMHTRYTQ